MIGSPTDMEAVGGSIREAVKQACEANMTAVRRVTKAEVAQTSEIKEARLGFSDRFILSIGASTGGTEAIKAVLLGLPAEIPPTVIVQHMPPTFTRYFAERLNELARFRVKEAREGDELRPGLALLAPGDFHMRVVENRRGAWCVTLSKEPPLHGVRPAVDVMMQSVAERAGRHALGIILTGMGKDGAAGLKAMRDAGARTIAQDRATCVVYGMPRAAAEIGAAETVLPLKEIAREVVERLRLKRSA
jgi:two-component system chemotaxis response regulator CheB